MHSLASYKALLRHFLRSGYRDRLFTEEFDPFGNLFLRHDIDLCLEKARQLAACEYEEGVRATYFILLDTEFYNAFSSGNRKIIQEIGSYGHEIGLHFDTSPFDDYQELEARVAQEIGMLENLIETPVCVVAPHRPNQSFRGNPGDICERVHPYQPQFFNDIHYVSDSLGGWTRDHPIDCDAFRSGRTIQILTHPYIWTTPCARSQTERIQQVLGQKSVSLDLAAKKNFKTYRPYQSAIPDENHVEEMRF